jgi:tetratricopeptide (TPR) repeat protein
MNAARKWFPGLWLVVGGLALASSLRAEDPLAAFDQANRLYEQGQFTNAAAAYQKVIESGHGSATLYFNLGNARFKAGQLGRAIAAYRHAERLAPRDPYVRFNLEFARKQATGGEPAARPLWTQFLSALTLNEWSALAVAGWWLWFALLSAREIRPELGRTLRGSIVTAGVLALLLCACLGAALYAQAGARSAVVVVPNAVVRRGPLEESQVFYQLRDGSEVTVLDEKRASDKESWLQVRDESRRVGWLKRDQVLTLGRSG